MGQAFDRDGNLLGEAEGDTRADVLEKLEREHAHAAEIHIRERLKKLKEELTQRARPPRSAHEGADTLSRVEQELHGPAGGAPAAATMSATESTGIHALIEKWRADADFNPRETSPGYSHGLRKCAGELASLTQPGAAKVDGWSNERIATALLSDLYRLLDAGGLSHGRSLQSDLLEPALALMNRHRPSGDMNEWPSRREVIAMAKERLRELTQPGAASPKKLPHPNQSNGFPCRCSECEAIRRQTQPGAAGQE